MNLDVPRSATPPTAFRRVLRGVPLAAILLLASCSSVPTPKEGGTFVVGSTVDVDSWNEYLTGQAFAVSVHRRIWLRLAQEAGTGPDGLPRWEPLLAEGWDDSPDGLSLTFHLRDMTWSDGTAMTSADVRFTWLAQRAPEVAWVGAGSKEAIVDVETPDARTVVFRFARAYPERFADAVDGGILPQHVFGVVPFERWRTHDWSTVRVGSGPFLPSRHLPGEEIDLDRNPAYFRKGLPHLDRVVIRIVPDAANLLAQFLAGALDWLEGVPPQDAGRIRTLAGARMVALRTPGFDYVGWNGARPPFDDPAVRRALGLAIDLQSLVRDLLFGYGSPSVGPIPSSSWAAPRDSSALPFDPDEARRILASRGFGPDRPLAFELLTNSGNRLREAVAVKLQDQWGRIGVRATPRVLDSRALRERAAQGDYEAFVGGWRFAEKVDLPALFGKAALPPNGANVVRYAPPSLEPLLDALRSADGAEDARAAYHAVARRIVEDQPYTFLYEPQRVVAIGPRVSEAEVDIDADPLARLDRFRLVPGNGGS